MNSTPKTPSLHRHKPKLFKRLVSVCCQNRLACRVAARCLLGLVFGAISAFSPVAAMPEGTQVQGVVRDASGAVVPGADVKLMAGSYSAVTVTDPSGAFSFNGIPAPSGT